MRRLTSLLQDPEVVEVEELSSEEDGDELGELAAAGSGASDGRSTSHGGGKRRRTPSHREARALAASGVMDADSDSDASSEGEGKGSGRDGGSVGELRRGGPHGGLSKAKLVRAWKEELANEASLLAQGQQLLVRRRATRRRGIAPGDEAASPVRAIPGGGKRRRSSARSATSEDALIQKCSVCRHPFFEITQVCQAPCLFIAVAFLQPMHHRWAAGGAPPPVRPRPSR